MVESETEGDRMDKPAATSFWLVAFLPLGAVIVYGSSRHLYALCDWALWLLAPVLAMLALAARNELRALPAEGYASRRIAQKRNIVIEVAMALVALMLALVRPGFVNTPNEVAACLGDYAKPELQPADIQRARNEGLPTCFDGGQKLRGRQAPLDRILTEQASIARPTLPVAMLEQPSAAVEVAPRLGDSTVWVPTSANAQGP